METCIHRSYNETFHRISWFPGVPLKTRKKEWKSELELMIQLLNHEIVCFWIWGGNFRMRPSSFHQPLWYSMVSFEVVVPVKRVSEHLFANVARGWFLWQVFELIMGHYIPSVLRFVSTSHAMMLPFIFRYSSKGTGTSSKGSVWRQEKSKKSRLGMLLEEGGLNLSWLY